MGFNRLTDAEAERLALLLEELGEAQQAIGKILRHGYASYHPDSAEGNREALERELGDVQHAVDRLCAAGDVREVAIHEYAADKADRVTRYLHHQRRDPFVAPQRDQEKA
jgi:NTP pyrophosphatase (non-canonical NTP hydrolase)